MFQDHYHYAVSKLRAPAGKIALASHSANLSLATYLGTQEGNISLEHAITAAGLFATNTVFTGLANLVDVNPEDEKIRNKFWMGAQIGAAASLTELFTGELLGYLTIKGTEYFTG